MQRKTKETAVNVTIGLDGTGQCVAETPVPFLNHMLDVSAAQGCACVPPHLLRLMPACTCQQRSD